MKTESTKRILTRRPMLWTGLRVAEADLSLWIAAAAKRGISRAEFVREALREKAVRTLQNGDG